MRLSSRVALLLFFLAFFVASNCLGAEPAPRSTAPAEVLERFKIEKDSFFLLLPVEIKGKHYRLFLDTGAWCTAYDKPLWHLMGKTIGLEKMGTLTKDITAPFFEPPEAWLGKLPLPRDSAVGGVELATFRAKTGEEIDGILGMDFLKKHIFQIDYDRGEVAFLRSVGPDPGRRLKISLAGNYPHVWITIPGLDQPELFRIDTGSARGCVSGSLRTAAFDILVKKRKLTSLSESPTLSVAGLATERVGWLEGLVLAGDKHKNLSFGESRESYLSLDFWSRYVVTFDFPHGAIYVKKGRQFDRPCRQDRSGLPFLRVRGQTVVETVAEGYPADLAGIRPGDVLVQIDKERVNGMSLFTLYGRLCSEGKRVRLVVRRGAQQVEASLDLLAEK